MVSGSFKKAVSILILYIKFIISLSRKIWFVPFSWSNYLFNPLILFQGFPTVLLNLVTHLIVLLSFTQIESSTIEMELCISMFSYLTLMSLRINANIEIFLLIIILFCNDTWRGNRRNVKWFIEWNIRIHNSTLITFGSRRYPYSQEYLNNLWFT